MCGIVGAVAERDVVPILIEGLKRLEYRGYDSSGVVVLDTDHSLHRVRAPGKVREMEAMAKAEELHGRSGIAHTRWATHGKPTQSNAHPHICRKIVAVVHNGIIENHESLRAAQRKAGYEFTSETDTEVVVHQIHHHLESGKSLLKAMQATVGELHGAYALGVVSKTEPGVLVAARRGSPLVIGVGIGEHFIASDVAALIPVTQRFIFLEDGDVAELTKDRLTIFNAAGEVVERPLKVSELTADAAERGQYRHYMQKEIFEQPRAVAETLEGRINGQTVLRRPSASAPRKFSARCKACTSSPAAPVSTPAWWRVIGSNRWRAFRAASRWPASFVIASRWCAAIPWWWRFPNRAKPPTPWPRCKRPSNAASALRWRSATCRKARSCARPICR